jgi:ribosomal protein S2
MKKIEDLSILDLNIYSKYNLLYGRFFTAANSIFDRRQKDFVQINPSKAFHSVLSALKFLRLNCIGQSSDFNVIFLGTPFGMKDRFKLLAEQHDCPVILNWSPGLVSNYKLNKKVFSLIIVFDAKLLIEGYKELRDLNIPIFSFVSLDHPSIFVDYTVHLYVNSVKGGLFCYNLFFSLFKSIIREKQCMQQNELVSGRRYDKRKKSEVRFQKRF